MKSFIMLLLKLIPIKDAVEVIFKFLKNYVATTDTPADDALVEKLYQIWKLLSGLIPDSVKK